MDIWQSVIPSQPRSYNTYGRIMLTSISVLAAIIIAFASNLNEKESFRCNPNTTIASDLNAKNFVTTNCYMKYEKTYHRSMPVATFVVMNFGLMLLFSVVYVGFANSKVEKFESKSSQSIDDFGQESLQQEKRMHVFPFYIIHLLLGRVLPVFLFLLVLHSANFPVEFQCEYPTEIPTPKNETNPANQSTNYTTESTKPKIASNSTVECVNPLGEKFETLAISVLWADCIIGSAAMIEVIYLLYWCYCDVDNDFASDLEFCSIYLLEKRSMTIRQILKQLRKTLKEDEQFLNVNLGLDQNGETLQNLHFRFLLHNEIKSKYLQRHEIYNVHLKQDQASLKLPLVHLLPLEQLQIVIDNNSNHANGKTEHPHVLNLCGKIILFGRPGIGKTVVAKSVLYRWAQDKFLENRVVIFFKFRNFRRNKATTFKKMLRLGEGIPSGSNFDELYKFVLANPQKIILIFDAMDDIEVDVVRTLQELGDDTKNDYEDSMSMFTIYVKLLKEELLPGATILTTSRYSHRTENICYAFKIQFQTPLELLGFSKLEIGRYVKKFCQEDTDASDQLLETIENSPEFLSLCYVPAICVLVCSTLKECLESAKNETIQYRAKYLPKTMTELYQRAIRVILWNKLNYKQSFGTRDYLTSSIPRSPGDIMTTLKRLAKSNMESEEASFQLEFEDFSQRIISCGLLVSLPEQYYRFLHVTMHEFLAAMHIVDEVKNTMDVRLFFSSLSNYKDKPSWHLVLQFATGLLAEKIKRSAIDVPEETIRTSLVRLIQPLTASTNTNETPARRFALLLIKCFHEMQDPHNMKLCANEVDGRGNLSCDLRHLNILPVDCMSLFQFLINVRNLTHLNLSGNEISDLGCLALVNFLNQCTNLKYLNLTSNSISDEGIGIIGNKLNDRNRALTNLSLEINLITEEGIKSLCNAMTSGKLKLTYLSLRTNKLGYKGVENLCTALTHPNCRLTSLNLQSNNIGHEGVNFLCQAIQNPHCQVNDLSLGRNNITKEDLENICNVLKTANNRLTKLRLPMNKLTANDIEPLCEALKTSSCKLTELDLAGNNLKEDGAQCFKDALTDENSCGLRYLSLNGNQLQDTGVQFICQALESEHCELTNLQISCNEIGRDGAQYLCRALRNTNCKLRNLGIAGNNITRPDVQRIHDSSKYAQRQNPSRGTLMTLS